MSSKGYYTVRPPGKLGKSLTKVSMPILNRARGKIGSYNIYKNLPIGKRGGVRRRPYRARKGKKNSKLDNHVLKLVERRLATHDNYSTNKGIIWDANVAQQSMVVNTHGDVQIQSVLNGPDQIALIRAYLAGFFANIQKFSILESECFLDIQTRSNSMQYLDIYMFKCIRDLPMNATWTNYQTFFNYGLTNTGGAITANGTQPGVTPFMNPLWCQYFHCYKKKSIKLAPVGSGGVGSNNSLRLKFKMGETKWDSLRDGNFLQNIAFKGKTKVIIPVLRGAIGHDSVAPFTQIDLDKAGVVCMYSWQYKTAFFEEAAHDSTFVTTLTQPSTAYQEQILNTAVTGVVTLS